MRLNTSKLVTMTEAKEPTTGVFHFSETALVERVAESGETTRGSVWDVTIIRAGVSKNVIKLEGKQGSLFYSRETLQQSIPKFEGAKVFANKNGPHVEPSQKSVHDEVGWLSEARMEGDDMRARLHLLPSADWLRINLLAAYEKGKTDLYELSIHAGGNAHPERNGNIWLFNVESIDRVESVDVVPKGAAGGKFNSLLESRITGNHSQQNIRGHIPMNSLKLKMLALFTMLYPAFLESKNVDWLNVNENELFTHLLEADKAQPRMHLPDGAQLSESLIDEKLRTLKESLSLAPDPTRNDLRELHRAQCAVMLHSKLVNSGLPLPLQQSVTRKFEGKIFTEAELTNTITQEKELYGQLFPNAPHSIFAEAGIDRNEKVQLGLDGFFLTSSQSLKPVAPGSDEAKKLLKNVPPFRSIREAYIMITGDTEVSGQVNTRVRLTEAIDTTQFANAVKDALNKRLVRDYAQLGLDTWRGFADIVPLKDFKTQHRVRFGGYPNLPTVGQGASYAPLSSPTDEEVTYSPAKKGGTESITREAIMNDDVGAIQRIPTRLARAAAQTLHEFIYNFINPAVNPTYDPDATALYHANHSNIGSAALDATTLAAARLRLKKQSQAGNSKRIGLRGRFLVVPPDLEKTAYELLTPAFNKSNVVPEFLQQMGIVPIVVDYWTDTNNWVLVADKADVIGLEVGFVNGQETPEIFVSDLTNVGSWFTNDQITYKIRHEYGGEILDYRGFDGSIVA